jgi:hypothetical protein
MASVSARSPLSPLKKNRVCSSFDSTIPYFLKTALAQMWIIYDGGSGADLL